MVCLPPRCFSVSGAVSVMIGVGVFAWRVSLRCSDWRSQAGLGLFMLVVVAVCWIIILPLGNAAVARRQASENAANNAAMSKAIVQIESVRKRLGHVPSESEVTDLLEEPLPAVRGAGLELQIEYRCT